MPRRPTTPRRFHIDTPDGWTAVRTDREHRDSDIAAYLETVRATAKTPVADVEEWRAALARLAGEANQLGVVLFMIRVGIDAFGRAFLGTLSVSDISTAPDEASHEMVRRSQTPRDGDHRLGDDVEFDTGFGPAPLTTGWVPAAGATSLTLVDDDRLIVAHAYAAVPRTSRVLIATCMVGRRDHTDLARTLVRRLVSSYRPLEDEPDSSPRHPMWDRWMSSAENGTRQ